MPFKAKAKARGVQGYDYAAGLVSDKWGMSK